MKAHEQKKAIIVLAAVSTLAIFALIFPYTKEDSTGMLSATQKIYSQQVLYENSKPNTYKTVETKNPCKAVHCNRPVAEAHPVLDNYGKQLTDEQGNVWCKCDGLAELYYRVSPTRKY